MADSKVDIVLMKIEEHISDAFSHIPVQIRKWGINNIIQGSFSFLFGWKDDGKAVKLAATDAGALKTASVGAGLDTIDAKTGWAPLSEGSAIAFDQQAQRVEVTPTGYDLLIRLSKDGVTFGDQILCYANQMRQLDVATHSFKLQASGPNQARYTIVGMW